MFICPQKVLGYLPVRDGMRVADIGAGTGAYTLALAETLRESEVYAIEVRRDLFSRLQKEVNERDFRNVRCIWGNAERQFGTSLEDSCVDCVLVSNVLFQIEDKTEFLKELCRITRPGGNVVVIDWVDSFGHIGPTPEQVVSYENVRDMFEITKLTYTRNIPAGTYHYGAVFRR